MQYAAKAVRDNDNVITGWSNIYKVNPPGYIDRGFRKFYTDIDTKFPAIIFTGDKWDVVHDQAAEDAANTAETAREARRITGRQAKKQLRTVIADIDAASSLAQLKPILKRIVRLEMHLAEEVREL